jgi:secreted trypsin-like serine protease
MPKMLAFAVVGLALSQATCKPARRVDSSPYIVGGSDTEVSQFPFFVSLVLADGKRWSHHCGGAQIAAGVVLTAAHCVEFPEIDEAEFFSDLSPNLLKKGYLVWNLQSLDQLTTEGSLHDLLKARILGIKAHPQFDIYDKTSADLALVFYDPSTLAIETKSAKFQEAAETNEKMPASHGIAIGHGLVSSAQELWPKSLQMVRLPQVDIAVCRNAGPKDYEALNENFLCYGYLDKAGRNLCGGDSGGPLLSAHDPDLLLGIASWGPSDCDNKATPGVFSRVDYYHDWIVEEIELWQQSRP